jgi:hypothetical protein
MLLSLLVQIIDTHHGDKDQIDSAVAAFLVER